MTFTIDLEPETLDRLRAVAAARGEDPNHYAAAAIAEKVDRDAHPDSVVSADEIAALHAGVERGLQAEAEGRYRPAADVFADMEARYGLPAS